ncbi:hypothetical protein IMCC26207_1026 [Actinobacteria bacterium IMCC26207]|nr:hypothetical protein IMCC26207_1026 [Actinobacteria bacterium IMCC26207]
MKTPIGRLIVGPLLCGLVLSSCLVLSGCSPSVDKAQACRTERETVETALQAYKADKGVYPDSLTPLAEVWLKSDPSANWTYKAKSAEVSGISPTGKYKQFSFADCGGS